MFPEQKTNSQHSTGNNELNSFNQTIETKRKPERKRQKIDFFEPLSPCSSSSSQADCNFEPTIDMMVNDFDDEQTLNEEETLAALEDHDPTNEIETLKEESEMPIEELLAKYQRLAPLGETLHRKKKRSKPNLSKENVGPSSTTCKDNSSTNLHKHVVHDGDVEEGEHEINPIVPKSNSDSDNIATGVDEIVHSDFITPTSHLLDLYPEQSCIKVSEQENELCSIYDEDDSDEETEEDFVKKTIMVGSAYQAVIPEGLSQYGDVLPYENEDKLIWEPSQVSERKVEEYLLDARNIKPAANDEELTTTEDPNRLNSNTNTTQETNNNPQSTSENKCKSNQTTPTNIPKPNVEKDISGVIKDNEQALHILVLCGYDFKEALRRKRLNALPLTDSMSLWSEEECQKFEEGIKEHGKDFVKIRQNQVRTRTMRELVQFYYLWKKSERRDQNFANADTVDHMDIYLNESSDFGASTSTSQSGSTTVQAPIYAAKKSNSHTQKNLSILAGNSTTNNAKCATQLNMSSNKYYNNKQIDTLSVTNLKETKINLT